MALPITGVFSAIATPLDADLAPDATLLAQQARALLARGCHGIGILGTTGEANSFSVAERMALVDGAIAAGVPASALIPGVGMPSMSDTITLTRHAVAAGTGAVLMLPPFYLKAVTDEGLLASYSAIIEGVGDPRLKILLYHIPHISGVPLSHDLIRALRERFPDVVVGLKDSSSDRAGVHALIEAFPGFAVFPGNDTLLREALGVGAAGCITAASNLIAPDLRTIYDGTGDTDGAQARIEATRTLTLSAPQIPAVKAIIAHETGDPAWARVRPPLLPLDEATRARVVADWEAIKAGTPVPA